MALRQWLQRLDNAVVYGVGLGLLTIPVLLLLLFHDDAAFGGWRWLALGVGPLGMTITGGIAYHLTPSGKAASTGAAKRPWWPIERIALLSLVVPPIAAFVASLPFLVLLAIRLLIGFFIALQFAVTLLPWSIVTTALWTSVFVTLTHSADRSERAPFWPLLVIFALVLVPATWIVVDKALDHGMRPIGVVVERMRPDTRQTERRRLKVPAGFVPRTQRPFELIRGDDSGRRRLYEELQLLIGADTPPVPMTAQERQSGPLAARWSSAVLTVKIDGALRDNAEQSAVDAFAGLERECRKSASVDGLVPYERTPEQRCLWGGQGVKRFAAGSAPGRYEVVILCRYRELSPSAIAAGYAFPNSCEIEALNLKGWRVGLIFNERHLANWRQVIRQAIDFLDAHTVERTPDLPGANLSWIKVEGR